MSKKRAREVANVDTSLIEVYEDLAHEDEEIRLKAGHHLLTKHFPEANHEQKQKILKRLLRGLCSGRKAARLGFSVALTECLSQTRLLENSITAADVLNILESSTVADSNTSGQDERDHYFGRLFGSEAIIKSSLLFSKSERQQWSRLLDIICGISAKKIWLRQECGWILYNCVRQLEDHEDKQALIPLIAEKLVLHKLARTPEGLAIWITLQPQVENNRLPKSVWRYDSPLAKNDLQTLAQVLKDAKSSAKSETDFESQGSATWSAQLHFAWAVVLAELFKGEKKGDRTEFADFWLVAIDNGLFTPSNSPERKHWGLQLLQKVILSAPQEYLKECFTQHATNCLMQSLKDENRYLQKGSQKVLRALQTRAGNDDGAGKHLVLSLLKSTNFIDFDAVTRTKTMESMLISASDEQTVEMSNALTTFLRHPGTEIEADASNKRRNIIALQTKLFNHVVGAIGSDETQPSMDVPQHILQSWIKLLSNIDANDAPSPPLSALTRSFILQRIAAAFEQILKLGSTGRVLALDCIGLIKQWDISADQEIAAILDLGWQKFKRYHKLAQSNASKSQKSKTDMANKEKMKTAQVHQALGGTDGAEGLALLYGLIIFQAYSDELEAVPILEELIAFEAESVRSSKSKDLILANADGLIDILLSFASKPSKFLRRITLDIFATFASKFSRGGLTTLVHVLQARESKAGQEELFEAEGEVLHDEDAEESQQDSDVEMLDSDVEVIDADGVSTSDVSSMGSNSDSSADKDPESDSSSDSDTGSSASAVADDELLALEKSLAAALGTRKITSDDFEEDSSSSGSDSDMDDDQMMSLDEKLSEVFRTRAAAQSQSKSKQKENKAAKENMTNFKNRVLDMVDVYLKQEARNSNSLELVLPLLRLSRETTVKQLANKAIDLVKSFCNRCKGLHNLPVLDNSESKRETKAKKSFNGRHDDKSTDRSPSKQNDAVWAQGILSSIHEEVCFPSSNAHKNACNQSSILLAKTLVMNGTGLGVVVDIYSKTQVRMVTDETATVQEVFFRDWIGWCGSVKGKLGHK